MQLHKKPSNTSFRKVVPKPPRITSHESETPPISRTNPRKRAFHDEPSTAAEGNDASASTQQQAFELRSSPKRHKTIDWPLRNDFDHNGKPTKDSDAHARSPTSQRKRANRKAHRPSKFKEGSLNDKPSKQPPSAYLDQEGAMEDYVKNPGDRTSNGDTAYDPAKEPARLSGMFRFGKAVANALNPAMVWQGINGIWREKEQPVDAAKHLSRDRKDELFRVYEDLKATGFKDIKTTINPNFNSEKSPVGDKHHEPCCRSFRDSAIDVGEEATSEGRPMQDIGSRKSLRPPSASHDPRSKSPAFGASFGGRSLTHLRTPSFQDLKTVKSQTQLPSPRLRSSAAVVPLATVEPNDPTSARAIDTGLRRQPPKREVARVRRLHQRVSDLELKLETARQELEQSLRDAPSVPNIPTTVERKPFAPGNLPSLPSERLLSEHPVGVEKQSTVSVVQAHSGSATTEQERTGQFDLGPADSSLKSSFYMDPKRSIAHMKHRSRDNRTFRDRASRANSSTRRDITATSSVGSKKRSLPKIPSSSPRDSSPRDEEDVPPVPTLDVVLDASKVNQPKVTAERALRSRSAKHFPSESINGKRVIAYTSIQHTDRATSPFLGPPRSPSPTKSKSRGQKRGISPPPPSPTSAHKKRGVIYADDTVGQRTTGKDNLVVRGTSEADPELRPVLTCDGKAGNGMKLALDKALPDIQKEDYPWDEDVF